MLTASAAVALLNCKTCIVHSHPSHRQYEAKLLLMKRRQLRRRPSEAKLLPTRRRALISAPPQQRGLRKLLDVPMRLAGIDRHFRSVRPQLGRVLARIETRRPGVAQDVEVFGRVAARRQRP